MTALAVFGLIILVVVIVLTKFVTRQMPRDEDQVSEEWLKANRYDRRGDRP